MKDTIRKRKAKAKGKHAKAKSVPEQPVFKMWQLEVLEKGLLALAILVTLAFLAAACYVIGGVFVDIKHDELEYRCKNSSGSESEERSSPTPAGFSTLWPQTGTLNVSTSEETKITATSPSVTSPSVSTPSSTSTDTQSTSNRKTSAKPITEEPTTEKMTTEKSTTVTTAPIPEWKRRVFCDTTDERPECTSFNKEYCKIQCSNDFNLLYRDKTEKIFYKRDDTVDGKIAAWLHKSDMTLWIDTAECIVCVQSDSVVLSHGKTLKRYYPFEFSSTAIPRPAEVMAKGIWYNRTSYRMLSSWENQNKTYMAEYVFVDTLSQAGGFAEYSVRVPQGSFHTQPVYSARFGKWIGLNVRNTNNPNLWFGGISITEIPFAPPITYRSFDGASIIVSDNTETVASSSKSVEIVYGIGGYYAERNFTNTHISSSSTVTSASQLGSKLIYPCSHKSGSVTMYNGVLYACCSSLKTEWKIQCQSYNTKSQSAPEWANFAAPNSTNYRFYIRALQSKKATPQLIAISSSQTWWYNGVDWYELKQVERGQFVGFGKWEGDLVVGYAG